MKTVLKELLENNSASVQDKFYRQFSLLDRTTCPDLEELIAKVWELIGKNRISKSILYLSLLLKSNVDLLEKCIIRDKNTLLNTISSNILHDPHVLFDYTVYTGKHWCLELITNDKRFALNQLLAEPVYQKLLYLRIINTTNGPAGGFDKDLLEQTIASCSNKSVDTFWVDYTKEIGHLLKLLKYFQAKRPGINEKEFLTYASRCSILEVASNYLKHDTIEQVFAELDLSQMPHKEDLASQKEILSCYVLLADFFKLLLPCKGDVDVCSVTVHIQSRFMQVESHYLQIELLRVMFACIFMKRNHLKDSQGDSYICNSKELQAVLFTIKSLVEELAYKKVFENDPDHIKELQEIHKVVADAAWRLDVVTNVVKPNKSETKLMHYMQADPESLINLCLKQEDFERAFQVLKIFNMMSTSLAREIVYTKKLQDLKDKLQRTLKVAKIGESHPDSLVNILNVKLKLDEIAEDFFQKNPPPHVEDYPLINNNVLFMNILDLAITQTPPSKALLRLASKYSPMDASESPFSLISKKLLQLSSEQENLTLIDMPFDREEQNRDEAFYTLLHSLYEDFCEALVLSAEGGLNKDHPSHQLIQRLHKHCSDYLQGKFRPEELSSYLQKLWNYLKAFSRVFYIEKDSSDIVADGKNSSFFKLLDHNRSELMGNLLFEQNLNPVEFEKYFGKLKLDFLYHVAGNCFPTINLHADEHVAKEELYHENVLYPINESIISYIKKRNWLLALILIEMYKVEDVEFDVGELRIRNFLNYLHLPKIRHLQPLFNCNEIITALQNDIPFQKMHDFVYTEIGKNFTCSSQSGHSVHSLETAQEIGEDQLKTTNWKRLASVVDCIPEKQLKNGDFRSLKDLVLVNLVKDAFECEYYKFALEVSDRNTRIGLLLENMKIWPEDFCIRSIKSETSRFDQEDDGKIAELKAWLQHIEQSKKVMDVLKVSNWASLYEMCAFLPQTVLLKLLESKQVDLLIEFLQLHEVSEEMLLCIDEHFLETAFDLDLDFSSIERLFRFLPPEHTFALCQNLLSILKDVRHLQVVTDYLLRRTNDDTLRNVALSLKMLSVFSVSEFDQQLLFLLRDPMSIIEVLIMNTKLDKLGEILELIEVEIREDVVSVTEIDKMLRRYAEKSLDFRVIAQPNPQLLRTPEHSLMQSFDSIQLGLQAAAFVMPEDVPTRDEWVANSEVIECMCCRNECFSMFNRRHHCRRCGRVICYGCSQKRMLVPTYGDILVRVCIQCYQQTFAESGLGDESMSTRSMLNDYWMLTGDSDHNRIVRQEFSYEFAPSVSLCLALMKFHSKSDTYARFLLDQCDLLLKLLVPSQEPIQEIDYMLVIRMLKSLALAAKMAAQDTSSAQLTSSSADQFLTQAELLGLLAERGCLNLLPTSSSSCFVDSSALMRFIEKLLEREQWTLALEVSTKAGIDKSGVFAAWGKSCLKAGDFASAREKFSKSYDGDHSSLKVIKNPPKLNEIIKILESKMDTIDEEFLSKHQNRMKAGHATRQSDRAVFILSKLKNLKNISAGSYTTNKGKSKEQTCRKPQLHDMIYQECVFYLDKYGSAYSLVEFHVKYGQFAKALDSMIKKRLSADEFVDIYMRCLKVGSVGVLQAQMSEMDPSLGIWKDYLVKICRHLTKQNLLHSLHQLQQYMGDYVRAAMTCIKFYEEKATSFNDLLQRSNYLIDALKHLAHGREQDQWVAVSPVETGDCVDTFEETSIVSALIKQMTAEEIEKHSATIQMQIEVTQFLASCESRYVYPMQVFLEIFSNPDQIPRHRIPVPTLFGPEEQRKYVAVLCFICAQDIDQGFGFGSRIINEFKQLKPARVYKETAKYLANAGRIDDIVNLVFHVKGAAQDESVHEVCDEVLIFAIAALKKTETSEGQIEELIKLIADKSSKISAYIEAKQLKKAYFLATKHKKAVDLKKILREAEQTNQTLLRDLCKKAIQHLEKTTTSKT